MIFNLLKNSDWAFLLDFVSPAFFKVIPPLELVSNASSLAKRTRDQNLHRTSLERMQAHFGRVLPSVKIEAGHMQQTPPRAESAGIALKSADQRVRTTLAETIVEIYFAQIMSRSHVLLDLRLSRMSFDGERLLWTPAPLIGVFSDNFLVAMDELYRAYYCGQTENMKLALKKIDLDWAHEVFIEHFGEGHQSEVRFTLSHFVHTFHQIFMLCKEKRKNLKGEFVQLGVLLGLMYESIETLDVSVDVRSAFLRVLRAQDRDSDPYP